MPAVPSVTSAVCLRGGQPPGDALPTNGVLSRVLTTECKSHARFCVSVFRLVVRGTFVRRAAYLFYAVGAVFSGPQERNPSAVQPAEFRCARAIVTFFAAYVICLVAVSLCPWLPKPYAHNPPATTL